MLCQSGADGAAVGHQGSYVVATDALAVVADQTKPVAAICDVTMRDAVTWYVHCHVFGMPPRRHVAYADRAVFMQADLHGSDRGFDVVYAGLNPAHMGQCGDQSDGAVSTHAEFSTFSAE